MNAAPKPKDSHVWDRDDLDWYVEPESVTDALLTVERFIGLTLDPCCGGGNIVRAMRRGGYRAFGSDVVHRVDGQPDWLLSQKDFLNPKVEWVCAENIVMNPPFFRAKGAEAFIRKAITVATGKVCAFVDIKFLAGGARGAGIWADHPPTRVWILSNRPSCPPGAHLLAGGEAKGGTADWCWLVWDLTAPQGSTSLGWLRRSA